MKKDLPKIIKVFKLATATVHVGPAYGKNSKRGVTPTFADFVVVFAISLYNSKDVFIFSKGDLVAVQIRKNHRLFLIN